MNKLRIGVIGAGSISAMHLDAYAANKEVELVAICDMNRGRAEEKAAKYNIPNVYTDVHELLANEEVDAVSICTWNNTHAEFSIAALEAGKHVLCEKPLCQTVEQALKVEEAVRRSGKVFQVGFVRRYGQTTQILRRFIEAGDLGEIYYAKASYLRRLGNPGGWFSDKERSGGGPLIDIGVHVIDLCWYLMGRPKVKSVSGNTYYKLGNRANVEYFSFYQAADYDATKNDVEDMANALIRFENGASLMVDVSFTLHAVKNDTTISIHGTKGGAQVEPELQIAAEKHDVMINLLPQADRLSFDFVAGFNSEIEHFVGCCLGRLETLSPVEDGVEMMKMLCAVYESAASGQEIRFDINR
ncbi:Gfo/Idh/MocA family protein [Paenibacillus radicis (ex Xue et al. 2023)]|uniref:Gfo/Idh/MocA family oxidoreductase n=1 Tax=Paenibacillus radicis (ex Xue et al. 2023) TaxID=2972489 RepID=A0ABT1YMF7_9BACL|nr:Gfo/Idh/MocA family oxidoreductase [Paenibacillus radicis (ex Xue et al. 2023)]MCR8634352.1 Gfo/Idh/MocA family oxidoreductase [Paenibacillus radicis (ex Xue et al. 2023)]